MNTFLKAQLLVLVLVASVTVWGQTGSPSSSPAGESKSGSVTVNPVRVSEKAEEGLLIRRVVPRYPEYARENRIQGTVVLHAIIDKQGYVTDLKIVAGHRAFTPTVVDAVRQWRYRPYFLNGQVVEVETTITVNFHLTPTPMPTQRSHSHLPIPESLQAPMSQ